MCGLRGVVVVVVVVVVVGFGGEGALNGGVGSGLLSKSTPGLTDLADLVGLGEAPALEAFHCEGLSGLRWSVFLGAEPRLAIRSWFRR